MLQARRIAGARHGRRRPPTIGVSSGLASHEYFHSWNVKRIKPAAFAPYDLGRENYTRQLWAFEGITSYYDDLALVRSGVIDPASYLELVGAEHHERTARAGPACPERRPIRVSMRGSSSTAAMRTLPTRSSATTRKARSWRSRSISTLRKARSKSLDDLMRALWQRYGQTGVGVPEDGVESLAIELAGASLSDFFARFVDGTEDPPLAALLGDFGVTLLPSTRRGESDRGGKPAATAATTSRREDGSGRAFGRQPADVAACLPRRSGGARRARGRRCRLAIDGLRMSVGAIEKLLCRRRRGETLAVHAFRRDELIATELTLAPAPNDTCWLSLDAKVDDGTHSRRIAWLGRDA